MVLKFTGNVFRGLEITDFPKSEFSTEYSGNLGRKVK